MAWPQTAVATIPVDCAFESHQNIVNTATIDKHHPTPLSKPFEVAINLRRESKLAVTSYLIRVPF